MNRAEMIEWMKSFDGWQSKVDVSDLNDLSDDELAEQFHELHSYAESGCGISG